MAQQYLFIAILCVKMSRVNKALTVSGKNVYFFTVLVNVTKQKLANLTIPDIADKSQ